MLHARPKALDSLPPSSNRSAPRCSQARRQRRQARAQSSRGGWTNRMGSHPSRECTRAGRCGPILGRVRRASARQASTTGARMQWTIAENGVPASICASSTGPNCDCQPARRAYNTRRLTIALGISPPRSLASISRLMTIPVVTPAEVQMLPSLTHSAFTSTQSCRCFAGHSLRSRGCALFRMEARAALAAEKTDAAPKTSRI